MTQKKTSLAYKFICFLLRRFTPDYEFIGAENMPEEPAVIVANHCQIYGPVAAELHALRDDRIWCAGQMTVPKEVPAYAYADFWSQKPRSVRWFYRIFSYLIVPLAACIFGNARVIPVWRDKRLADTFRETLDTLEAGSDVVIFPEQDVPCNNILYDLQERFLDLARFYRKRTGRDLPFVPLYIAPKLGTIVVGAPIRFDPEANFKEERQRIRQALTDSITRMARELPPHTVVPYRNMPRRLYPRNTDPEKKAE